MKSLSVRLDNAKRLLRLAAPQSRGLRRIVLNTKSGRRAYWIGNPNEEKKEKKKPLKASDLGIRVEDMKKGRDFYSSSATSAGTPVEVYSENGEISFLINDSLVSKHSKPSDPVASLKKATRMILSEISKGKKGDVYWCHPFDSNYDLAQRKKKFYENLGFEEFNSTRSGRLSPVMFGVVGDDGKLVPMDRAIQEELIGASRMYKTEYYQDPDDIDKHNKEIRKEMERLSRSTGILDEDERREALSELEDKIIDLSDIPEPPPVVKIYLELKARTGERS